MKKIIVLLLSVIFIVQGLVAQDDNIRQSALGISFTLTDFPTSQRIRTSSLSSVLSNKQWAKFREMAPGIAVTYFKGLQKHIDFAGTLHGTFVNYPFANRPSFAADNLLLEADASVNLKMTTEKYWVIPYISLGVGANKYKGYWGAFAPVGLGLRINFFDEASIFINNQYRLPVTTETSTHHFYNSIGVSGIIGKKKEAVVVPQVIPPPPPPPAPEDTDNDGITDDKDKCPTEAGLAKYDGCPIPDTDKDGINDEEDKCKDVFGFARYGGCPIPDTDGDSINDEEDKCKDVVGVARYQGCPIPDGDSDGINDEEDKCPAVPGIAENMGCPEIKKEIVKKIEYAAKNVYFATGSFKLLTKSYAPLNTVVKILKDNPDLRLNIDGHTDNSGDAAKNMTLSENRANSVKQYLVSKGVDESRLTAAGHGSDEPVADNKTPAGRQKNRRVELKATY